MAGMVWFSYIIHKPLDAKMISVCVSVAQALFLYYLWVTRLKNKE